MYFLFVKLAKKRLHLQRICVTIEVQKIEKCPLFTNKCEGGTIMLTMEMLHDAQRVLSGVINKTPVIPSTGIT